MSANATMECMSIEAIEDLAFQALIAAGTCESNARPVARATAAHEADGVTSHGLAYIPVYCQHVNCGKVDGLAVPKVSHPRPGVIRVDAGTGFAHPAIEAGLSPLIAGARKLGVAAMAVHNSYNCGVLGYHTERLAREGLVGLGFTNAPASMAPIGGRKPVFGTNPFSLAVPGEDGEATVLIDQSASVVAKSEIARHAAAKRTIPEGWALDAEGRPTTDPNVALTGSMVPSGDYKGIGVALMVELMAACMTGATLGVHASPFSGVSGGPPKTGQFFLALDPGATSGDAFAERLAVLAEAVREQPGARLPGDGRRAARREAVRSGVAVSPETLTRIRAWLGHPRKPGNVTPLS